MNSYTLDELGFVGRGKSKHRPRNDTSLYGGVYPFLQTADVKHSLFYITRYSQTYNEKGLKQSKLWDKGTLCITIAANIADTAILDFPACFPDSIVGFVPNADLADVKFVKYCLDTYQKQMRLISQGTTQDNMSLEKILSLKFNVPPLSVQRKVAAILAAYDDLIETNNQRIQLLEKMVEEIYKEWFVRLRFPGHETVKVVKGVPEGWQIKPLSELAEVNPKRDGKNTLDWIDYIDIGSVSTKSIGNTSSYSIKEAPGRAKRVLSHGDILWASVRPANKAFSLVLNPAENLIASTGFAVISAKNDLYPFVYQAVTTDTYVEQISLLAKGANYPATGFEDFAKSAILTPPKQLIEAFCDLALPICEKQYIFQNQNSNLAQTRDKLLPRLISGKLSVENLDINFPPSMEDALA